MTILFTDGAEAGQARPILDYVGATGVISWAKALTGTPADAVAFIILSNHQVQLLTATQTSIDAIETDTNEIQGKLPTNNIMGSSVLTDKDDEIDNIKTAVDAIKLETDKLTLGDAGAGSAGSIIEEIENRPTTAMRGTDNAALASEVTATRMAELDDSARVVTIFPDSGLRYLSTIFNDDWMRERGFLDSPA